MNVKGYIGAAFKTVIALVVILFLGLKSLDFFYFVTPADQWYYAYLGFGLTGGGVIAYLVIFLWDANTSLKKAIAIGMLAFCVLGELATAGFGLQINAWKAGGYQLSESDFNSMVLVIQLLGFVHAMALIGYVAGDPIKQAFGDDDGDGIPNYRDPDYKPETKQNKGSVLRFPWSKKPTPEPVRQFSAESDEIRKVTIPEDVYKQLLVDAGVGQGNTGGNGANPQTGQRH